MIIYSQNWQQSWKIIKQTKIKSDKDLPLKVKDKDSKKQSNYKIDDPGEIVKSKKLKIF